MYYKKLVGKDIYLSPCDVENELPILTKWFNEDRDIISNNGFSSKLLGVDKTKEMLEQWNAGPYCFSIVNLDNEFAGQLSLFDLNHNRATMGIFVGEQFRGKGYGSQAIKLITDYAFNMLNLRTIHIYVYGFNQKAISVYKKVGFVECGRWHQDVYYDGKYYDTVMMELLKNN